MFLRTLDTPQPQFHNQHRIAGNQIRNALVSIGQMRTQAYFPITADFHTHERMLDSGNRLATAEHDAVIDECESCLNSHHVFGKLFAWISLSDTSSPWFRKILLL